MEARVAKLEATLQHVQSDCADIKAEARTIRDKVDNVKDTLAGAKVWALVLYIGLAGALLYAMARGFKWL